MGGCTKECSTCSTWLHQGRLLCLRCRSLARRAGRTHLAAACCGARVLCMRWSVTGIWEARGCGAVDQDEEPVRNLAAARQLHHAPPNAKRVVSKDCLLNVRCTVEISNLSSQELLREPCTLPGVWLNLLARGLGMCGFECRVSHLEEAFACCLQTVRSPHSSTRHHRLAGGSAYGTCGSGLRPSLQLRFTDGLGFRPS